MLNVDGFKNLYYRFFGTHSDRVLKGIMPIVQDIESRSAKMNALSDHELRAMTAKFRERIDNGASLEDILPEAFATVREAATRSLGMTHYPVQLMGGILLHRGTVTEMRTGEGKTLVGTLPVYLNALTGKGAHVITVNDYLAERDADWMGTVYRFLGLSVGTILTTDRNVTSKQAAYKCDITYGTNSEFGFDYLRDNMKFSLKDYVQRGHNFAIIDEVDSILIDEARTPLIISGPARHNAERYLEIDAYIPTLQNQRHYIIIERNRNVTLTDDGIAILENRLGIQNLYSADHLETLHHVNQALKANFLFRRDIDYMVLGGRVVIIDENTGRPMDGRRWSDGLHQAIEAKERVDIQAESQTYATITYQNYFRLYDKLAGMTGTAETESEEFEKIYNLDVVVIPTNKPIARLDHDDIIFKTESEKFAAVMKEVKRAHSTGQPILIGTTSVEASSKVHKYLQMYNIDHEVLNAKQHHRESEIVAQAGRLGAVTVSTNMAGRGTDIKLGGDPEKLARAEFDPESNPEGYQEAFARYQVQCAEEKEKVLAAGGLYIIGTERHESRRIDNQLRGRSGRQGDPGASRFYLALEDQLLRIFGSDKLIVWMERMGMKDNEPIEHKWVTKQIETAQMKVEGHHFNTRKQLLEYDDIMNLQRMAIYEMRRRALAGDNIKELIDTAIQSLTEDVLTECMDPNINAQEWDIDLLREHCTRIFELEWQESDEDIRDFAYAEIKSHIINHAHERYFNKTEELGDDQMSNLEQMLLLQLTDSYWKDHLLAMDRLRDGIGLRGFGQLNPLLEYKREGTDLFMLMNSLRDESLLRNLLNFKPEMVGMLDGSKPNARRIVSGEGPVQSADNGLDMLSDFVEVDLSKHSEEPEQEEVLEAEKPARPEKGEAAKRWGLEHEIGRNEPCPCGSGMKFKKCCFKVELTT
ncbi:MAG: preprotein translocase subunit SecA [Myxococcota bacterium]|nr:preprotein translocase subunit SecA [Myxococcota bacterium]